MHVFSESSAPRERIFLRANGSCRHSRPPPIGGEEERKGLKAADATLTGMAHDIEIVGGGQRVANLKWITVSVFGLI